MATVPAPAPFGAKEIFRYAKIRQPRIIDILQRARASSKLKAVVGKSAAERTKWARAEIKSSRSVGSEADLRFPYFSHLSIKTLPADRLPSRKAVKDPPAFAAAGFSADRNYRADLDNCLASLLAFKILRDDEAAGKVARLLGFVELFPELHRTEEELDYPSAVLTKVEFKVAPVPPPRPPEGQRPEDREAARDMGRLARNIKALWTVRNNLLAAQRAKLDDRYRELTTVAPVDQALATKARSAKQARSQQSARLAARIKQRREGLIALREEYRVAPETLTLGAMLDMPPKQLSSNGAPGTDLVVLQKETKALLEKHGVVATTFADTYKKVGETGDALGVQPSESAEVDCYKENPKLMFGDSVRLLGHADLIRVDETFIKYEPGEISYIENILPGEVMKREVKSTKYFETVVETMTQEDRESATESSVTTKQDLGSQVATELATRMNSEMSASANGSGGGTIGVVDFKGAASASANLGIGVDSSLKTENTSNFSQEIISKAVEKTKSSSIERRMTRTYSLYETLNSHEINNQGSDSRARNGIYCFLDRHVCLTESVYGKRLFLMANLHMPGRNLLCEREQRLRLGMSELGPRPQFTISVDEVQPSTYKELVTRFKASNVSPPPPQIQTIAKTYKTDNTNANAEKQGMDLKKAADVLTPFFEQYKRYLITENIRLPEGYEVREVTAAINHGRNGISIPAHLPLKLAGAAMGSAFTVAGAVASGYFSMLLLPAAVLQFEYAVSPLLHYNTDSSNVSLCVGTETLPSPYFFFDPDFLMEEVLNAFSNFIASAPDLLTEIETKAGQLLEQLQTKADEVSEEVVGIVQGVINDLIENIKNALSSIRISGSIRRGLKATFGDISRAVADAGELADKLKAQFSPLNDFILAVVQLLRDGIARAIADIFNVVASLTKETQVLSFANVDGISGELPVSINAVAINPGITINLVASLSRTDEALDRWRLETFEALYQGYVQQLADYESKAMMANNADRITRSPNSLRQEEALALKELILYALNNSRGPAGNQYSFEKINFLENALDWDNMSFRVFNYGPNANEIDMDKRGVFAGVDERRKAFLKAPWAQALIPVQPDPRLEQQIGQFFLDGTFNLEGGLDNDELAALYQDLITGRSRIANAPQPVPIGHEVLPTDFIIIQETLPTNPETPCGPIQPIA